MLFLLVYLLIISPVRLTITWDQRLDLHVRLWGLWRIPLRLPDGQRQAHRRNPLHDPRIRRFLFRHTHLVSLQALLRLGLGDAALTAVFSGLLQQLARLFPEKADVRIQPDFVSPTRIQVRCILFFHLGTLLVTAGMLLLRRQKQKRRVPHPKEA